MAPSIQLAQQIYEELRKIVFEINFPELARFEALNLKLQEVMQSLLANSLKPTEEMIRNLIQIELGFINRNHPNFLDGADAILEILKGAQDENKNPDLSKLEKKPETTAPAKDSKKTGPKEYNNSSVKL